MVLTTAETQTIAHGVYTQYLVAMFRPKIGAARILNTVRHHGSARTFTMTDTSCCGRTDSVWESGIAWLTATPSKCFTMLVSWCVRRDLEAQPAGERGALWGVPFAVKDNIDALPHPTTAACDAFRYTPTASASTVAALESEGEALMPHWPSSTSTPVHTPELPGQPACSWQVTHASDVNGSAPQASRCRTCRDPS